MLLSALVRVHPVNEKILLCTNIEAGLAMLGLVLATVHQCRDQAAVL